MQKLPTMPTYRIVDRGDGLSGAISGVLSVACKFDGGLEIDMNAITITLLYSHMT